MRRTSEPDRVEVIRYNFRRRTSTVSIIEIAPSTKCVKCNRKAATTINPICKYCQLNFEAELGKL